MAEYGDYGTQRFKTFNSSPVPAPVRVPVPFCPGCNDPCVMKVTKKEGANQGREFYTCPKNPSCPKSFKWADGKESNEPPRVASRRDASPTRPDPSGAIQARLTVLEAKIDQLVAVMTGNLGGVARPMGQTYE
jgi:GRF zinc finger